MAFEVFDALVGNGGPLAALLILTDGPWLVWLFLGHPTTRGCARRMR